MAGRPPKPTADLKLHGGFRADRHGDRVDVAMPSGLPPKPDGLDPAAGEHWDRIVDHIGKTGVLAEIDAEEVEKAARYWSLWRRSISSCEADVTDKDARLNAVAFGQEWSKSASKLGLNPIDRARLRAPKKAEQGVMSRKRA
jgi:phage terminase small subunit